MKKFLAKYSNAMLLSLASALVVTNCLIWIHRPETPEELLQK